MPFVQAKCTSCGGDIQLDDARESGFCTYCGAKVIFKEAIQRLELSGRVSVDGIASLEKLLQNAATFRRLGDTEKEEQILKQITNEYPEDHRAWLRLAQRETELWGDYDPSENKYGEQNPFSLSEQYDRISAKLRTPQKFYKNALMTAPESLKEGICSQAAQALRPYLPFFHIEREKMRSYNAYTAASGAALAAADAEFNNSLRAHKTADTLLSTVSGILLVAYFLYIIINSINNTERSIPLVFLGLLAILALSIIRSYACRRYDPIFKRRVIRAKKEQVIYRMEHFARVGIPFEYYAGNKYAGFFGSRPTRLTEEDLSRELEFWEKTVNEYESQNDKIPVV